MSFVVVAALAVGLLVLAPWVAHLLRRGRAREREFPPTGLVPLLAPLARRPGRLEDRLLFGIRALLVVGLAVLGATPLLKCTRLRVARPNGASVALGIILDDSLSMRAQDKRGASRWQRAVAGAHNLALSAREGDALAIVLAGRPARLALAPTTDLALVRRTLEQSKPSDRATDLEGAAALARSSLAGLAQSEKRVVLFSDLAGKPPPPGEPLLVAPLDDLREALVDCGVVSADRHGSRIETVIGCTSSVAASNRQVELVDAAGKPRATGTARLDAREGVQTVSLEAGSPSDGDQLRLTGKDDMSRDDSAPVAAEGSALLLGVVTDPTRSSVATGGPTVIEQALGALGVGSAVRPLVTLPEEERELGHLAALVVDDPAGLTPEARDALTSWLGRGGVALGLLGPSVQSASLGLSLEPFAAGGARWEPTPTPGIDPESVTWLGEEAKGLDQLRARGRVALDGARLPLGRVMATWTDGHAWLLAREVGRGLVETLGLPASIAESELALRPGFLAIFDHLLTEASRRQGPAQSPVGSVWTFPYKSQVEVVGPDGPVLCSEPARDNDKSVALGAAGRYQVRVDGQTQTRIVRWDVREILDRPVDPAPAGAGIIVGSRAEPIDVSREVALGVLLLLGLELVTRLLAGRKAALRLSASRGASASRTAPPARQTRPVARPTDS